MSTWPAGLPNPKLSFAGQVKANATRMQMESGRYRQQKKATTDERAYKATWSFSEAQYATFRTWYYDTLNNGSAWFDVTLPAAGQGLTTVSARIVNGEVSRANDNILYWDVSLHLEVRSANILTEEEYDALLV